MPSDPLVLGFDTSAAHCAAALLSGDRVLAERLEPMTRGQAERLMPLLEELLTGAGVGWRDLSAIGVGTGPGNFTGVRIAVAAARGLALGLGIPAVGVDGFAAVAEGLERPVTIALPGLRGAAYLRRILADDTWGEIATIDPDRPGVPDIVGQRVAGQRVAGPGADAAVFPGAVIVPVAVPLAVGIARVAARLAGTPGLSRPAPLYLRAADAAPPADPPPVLLPD